MKPLAFVSFVALFLSSCAKGPLYSDVKRSGSISPPTGKATVLVYWPNSIKEGQGNWTKVYVNNALIEEKLRPGGFCVHYAKPGFLRISSGFVEGTQKDYVKAVILDGPAGVIEVDAWKRKDRLDINAVEGATYYVETHITQSLAEKMTLVPAGQGEKNIQNCHWTSRE